MDNLGLAWDLQLILKIHLSDNSGLLGGPNIGFRVRQYEERGVTNMEN